MRKTLFLTAIASLSITVAAYGQVVASDSFPYTGALTSNGWTAHSGAGNKVVTSNGVHATLDQGLGSGEDVSLTFAALGATDAVYASFRFRVPSGTPVTPPAAGMYFAHFKDATTAFRARTGVLAPAAAGDFRVAIHADNANLSLGTAWGSDLAFDTWYSIVISWNASTGTSELWVNPTCGSATSVSHTGTFTGTLITAFALRQSSDYTGFMHVDDVVVGRTFGDVLPGSGTFSVTCGGCAGLTQTASGSPNLGGTASYSVPGATAVILGVSNLCLPLCPAGCNLGTDTTIVIFASQFALSVPCASHLIGATVYTQGVSVGAGGCNPNVFGVALATSETIRTVIGS